MNKNIIILLLASVNSIQRPFKLGGSIIEFDEVPDVTDPIDPKKRFSEDIELLKNTIKENAHAQENMEMGSLNSELAKGLVDDVKHNLMEVTHHIEQDLSVDQDIDQSDDSQGKINME
jgi:hypothetical protein